MSASAMRLSVLDLAPIPEGGDASVALRNTAALAQAADRLGYERYWVAEHHGMAGIASAATSVVIAHVAGCTQRIRVGSGGIMLPNHSPLVIAEQFGTLESLFPGRIDLGLGRAPGTDQRTARALRRDLASSAEHFVDDVLELQAYFQPAVEGQAIKAVPGEGLDIPLWILGSSLYGAQVAAALGLPYAFAAHFAPDQLHPALEIYRRTFKPSGQLAEPYALVCINVVAADTEAQARRLFTTVQQGFLYLRRGMPGKVRAPVDNIDELWTPSERASVDHALAYSVVGAADTVRRGLDEVRERTGADEIMIAAQVHDPEARIRSYEIVADVAGL